MWECVQLREQLGLSLTPRHHNLERRNARQMSRQFVHWRNDDVNTGQASHWYLFSCLQLYSYELSRKYVTECDNPPVFVVTHLMWHLDRHLLLMCQGVGPGQPIKISPQFTTGCRLGWGQVQCSHCWLDFLRTFHLSCQSGDTAGSG